MAIIYYMRVGNYVYLCGEKLLLTFFIQRLQAFLFMSRFLNVFFIFEQRFFHLCIVSCHFMRDKLLLLLLLLLLLRG